MGEAEMVELRGVPNVSEALEQRREQCTRYRERPPQAPSPSPSSFSHTIATMISPLGRINVPSHPFPSSTTSVLLVLIDAPSSPNGVLLVAAELNAILLSRSTSTRACCTLGRLRSSRSRMRTWGRSLATVGVGLRYISAESRRV